MGHVTAQDRYRLSAAAQDGIAANLRLTYRQHPQSERKANYGSWSLADPAILQIDSTLLTVRELGVKVGYRATIFDKPMSATAAQESVS